MSGPKLALVEDDLLLAANLEPMLVCFPTEQRRGFGLERAPYQRGLAVHLVAIPGVAITKRDLDEAGLIEGASGVVGRIQIECQPYHLAKRPHRGG